MQNLTAHQKEVLYKGFKKNTQESSSNKNLKGNQEKMNVRRKIHDFQEARKLKESLEF